MSFSRCFLALGATTAAVAIALANPVGAQTVPTDPQGGCPIAPAAVAAMFQSGSVTLNGVVKPADSTVNLVPNCGFFTWTEQMFLWLTSPAPRRYGGGGGRIMFSPSFYSVSPMDSAGRRTFTRNDPSQPFRMFLRTTELGPHLLPALITKTGQIVEVQPRDPRLPVPKMVRLQSGALAPLADVRRSAGGQLQFLDARGRALQVRKLALPPIKRTHLVTPEGQRLAVVPPSAVQNAIQAQKIVFHNIPVFLDASNNVIEVEPGQADGGVLLTQGGSLIYYITSVNDVFAWHRTMQGAALIPSNTNITFPMTMADANAVQAFAVAHGGSVVDPEALAIETKSSWVEASSVANPNDYVQVKAQIPTFDKSNPEMWVPNGVQTVNLVMVGLHVVGSTFNHGEMVWGTFEHLGNAPNAAYTYTSTTGSKTIAQNTVGSWLFTPSGSAGPFNTMKASWDTSTGNLVSTNPGTPIGPSPILRSFPWGSTSSSLNTQVISSNASVISQLIGGDVRKNYFQLGTTWTINGQAPNGANEVGTSQLANTTMETFVQGSNCFSCHLTNKVAVSHVYRQAKPLP